VVEEDAALTEAIGARLGRAGFRVEAVGGADEAVARIARAAPDAVVLGVRAPGMAGLERTHRLAAALEGGEVPLLLLSILEAPAAPAAPQGPAGPAAPPGRPDQARLLERVNRALAGAAPDGRRVLVIEDDPSVRELLAVALRKQGLEVLEAPDGETGLALAREGRPALILLDLRLPGIDGFAVLEALKRTPDTASIPVIAVTGNEGLWLGARARVLSLGAADFVTKPFELDALIAEIRLLMRDGSGGVGPAPARTDADAEPAATGEAREEGHHADTRAGR
jgi:DNA-binding response OmpR family regulator